MKGLETSLTLLVGIDLPIIQAPIGGASTPELVAAVSNAGGLGMLSITWRPPDDCRRAIREIRQRTDQPFGVNLVLHWDPEENLRIALEEQVPVVSFFWGDPSPWIPAVHESNALVFHTVGTADEARHVAENRADVIVAQGWEAGGHVWGSVATMALGPAVVDAVDPIPVVLAGGIGDGRGLASALSLGAAGVWMGTRFLLATEADTHDFYRENIRAASESSTIHTDLFDQGWPESPLRSLQNETFTEWVSAGRPPTGNRPGEDDVVAFNSEGETITRYASQCPTRGATGQLDRLVQYAGQSVAQARTVQPASEIVSEIVSEASEVLSELGKRFPAEKSTSKGTTHP